MKLINLTLFFLLLLNISLLAAENNDRLDSDNNKIMSLTNDYLKINVNSSKLDTGRFSIDTTNGSPLSLDDNNKVLIYGKPVPWSSYTTIQLNNKSFIFGGFSKKTNKRSKTFNYSNSTIVEKTDDSIQASAKYNQIDVIQNLSFVRNPITKVKDMVLIEYHIFNKTAATQNIGVRVMLDTKLGDNDASPFRVKEKAVVNEHKLFDLPSFWQTFNDLSSPNIIAQGILENKKLKINKPEYMILSNWGSLLENEWSFPYKQNRSFKRSGESENDTALALYWPPQIVRPKSSMTVKTTYGIGNLKRVIGELSIGLSCQSELFESANESFLGMLYISNTGQFESKNTIISIALPKGITLKNNSTEIQLGNLKIGDLKQIPLEFQQKENLKIDSEIKFTVKSNTLAENKLIHKINLIPSPKFSIQLQKNSNYFNNINQLVSVNYHIINNTNRMIKDVVTKLKTDYLSNYDYSRKKHLISINFQANSYHGI